MLDHSLVFEHIIKVTECNTCIGRIWNLEGASLIRAQLFFFFRLTITALRFHLCLVYSEQRWKQIKLHSKTYTVK